MFTKSKMGMKIKDWATRRVLAVVCIIVIVSILLIPWLKALLNETEEAVFFDTSSLVNLSSEEDEGGKDVPFTVYPTRTVICEIGAGSYILLKPKHPLLTTTTVTIMLSNDNIVRTIGSFKLEPFSDHQIFIPIHSKNVAGHCVMSFKSNSEGLDGLHLLRIQITVVHKIVYGYLTVILGWCYVLMWSATYYPQLYKNWRRRSVVGFSFDYIALNITGHICYCVFNMSMFYSGHVQEAYADLHPKGRLPVKEVDVYFSIHAVSMNLLLILQCLLFDRGQQKVSLVIVTLVGGFWLMMSAGLFAAIQEKVTWLEYIYWLSYIKVGSTPIKYAPQLYMNYQKKSTDGWSIYSSMMDCLGGLFSVLQMAVDAFNNDDWSGPLGNPGKLGLGIISLVMNSGFGIQHFFLYNRTNAKRIGIL